MSKTNLKEKRYQIIKPFIDGEKKLKEIENESGVSYATLKRWVKSYKETGLTGLKKKTRKDKSHHRNISEKTFEFIKKTYEENPSIKITTLYEKCLNFLKDIQGESISYQTVYRVVSNLDNFIQSHAELHLERIKKRNQVYRMTSVELDVEALDPITGSPDRPILYICYDVATLDILNYRLSFKTFDLDDALLLLRETILKLKITEHNENFIFPEEFIIDSFKIKDSEKLNVIKNTLNINIYNYFKEVKEMNRFTSFLLEDIHKIIPQNLQVISLMSLDKLIFSYIYMSNKEYLNTWDIQSTRLPVEETLDIFLMSTFRRVQEYGIRFKNNLYKNNTLKEYLGQRVEIKYDSFNQNYIYIYIEDKYICTAYSI